jgi:large subunit ribosomal protein L31
MKKEIHPEYHNAQVQCGGCGASFSLGSTIKLIKVGVCSLCHPFYSGKQKFVDSEGRVDRFKKKFGSVKRV